MSRLPKPFETYINSDRMNNGTRMRMRIVLAVVSRRTGVLLWSGTRRYAIPHALDGTGVRRPLLTMSLRVDAIESLLAEFWRYLGAG